MTVRQISISEFKAHCTSELREVEKGDLVLELTRHGKTVAVVQAPAGSTPPPTMAEWIGSGAGLMAPVSADLFDEPTWAPEDWEMGQDDEN